MNSMKCYTCVLKHLSTALSFGKEILSGHSKGDELDHRIDFIGEVINAEQHLELINKNLFDEISSYRKEIQGKDVLIDPNDLDFLRQMYLKVENDKDGINNSLTKFEPLSINPDIVYLNVTNKDFFDFSYKTLKLHLKNYSKIYVLNSSIDLSEYNDIMVLNEDIKTFMNRNNITGDVLILNENMGILKDYDAKFIFPTYSKKISPDIFKDLKPNAERQVLLYDNLKIQPVNVKKFNEILKNQNYKYFLSAYFYWSNLELGVNDNQISVNVDRPVCCSIRTNLKTRIFMRWNSISFESLKNELKIS